MRGVGGGDFATTLEGKLTDYLPNSGAYPTIGFIVYEYHPAVT
jgi:hypothetical protein